MPTEALDIHKSHAKILQKILTLSVQMVRSLMLTAQTDYAPSVQCCDWLFSSWPVGQLA